MAHDGCRCKDCWGLTEHLAAHGLPDRGLPAAPGHTTKTTSLRIVTAGQPKAQDDAIVFDFTKPACTGSLTCNCPACEHERLEQVRRGPQGNGNADPFRRAA